MSSDSMVNISSLLIDAVIAAKKAGDAILEVYGTAFSFEQKEDRSPLTLADMRSHDVITGQLNGRQAGKLPILSEEGRDILYAERKAWEYYWLVDPLDGTKEFIKRNGEFTVNIALMHRDRPVMGVILVPVKDILYFAAEGTGAFRLSGTSALKNHLSFEELKRAAARLPLKTTAEARTFTAIASRSHMSGETSSFLEELKKEHGGIEIVSAGSSLKFCLVAEGAADIYPRFAPTMEWDTAAGQAIVEQAGGSVLQYGTGEPLRYNKENLLNPWFIVRRSLQSDILQKQREG
jgi:3'(2'), 5'-bisphosphate nucleotidase